MLRTATDERVGVLVANNRKNPPKIILTGLDHDARRGEVQRDKGAAEEPEGSQSLWINPARFRMLPPELRDYNCASCDRKNAGWAFLPVDRGPNPDPIPTCSLCWLYVSAWARSRPHEVREFVATFVAREGKDFLRDPDGNLTDHRQADRVVLNLLRASIIAVRLGARRGDA